MTNQPIPGFCNFSKAADWSYPINYSQLFEVAGTFRDKFKISSISHETPDISLLLIDTQKDFTLKEGALFVGGPSGEGAIEDSKRTAAFIYQNLGILKTIHASYDTHKALQIFFPSFWIDDKGKFVPPHTVILADDIRKGKYSPNPAVAHLCVSDTHYLRDYAINYCERLEAEGKYQLYIWPFHCLVGSEGHAMNGLIQEACAFHSFVRNAQTHYEFKGTNPWTENYSVFSPEVLFDHEGANIGHRNDQLFSDLFQAEALIIAGQASSHCLKSSIDDLIDEAAVRNPDFLSRIYVVEDCMSSVVIPGVADFTPQAEKALARYKRLGLNIVRSTIPIKQWPGISNIL